MFLQLRELFPQTTTGSERQRADCWLHIQTTSCLRGMTVESVWYLRNYLMNISDKQSPSPGHRSKHLGRISPPVGGRFTETRWLRPEHGTVSTAPRYDTTDVSITSPPQPSQSARLLDGNIELTEADNNKCWLPTSLHHCQPLPHYHSIQLHLTTDYNGLLLIFLLIFFWERDKILIISTSSYILACSQ